MNNCELVYLVSSLACAIAETVSNEELGILSAAFSQLGDSLALLALNQNNNSN